jgi:DNA-binding response OmpR family regulator
MDPDHHTRRPRKALAGGGHDSLIQTVRTAGYRLSIRN